MNQQMLKQSIITIEIGIILSVNITYWFPHVLVRLTCSSSSLKHVVDLVIVEVRIISFFTIRVSAHHNYN